MATIPNTKEAVLKYLGSFKGIVAAKWAVENPSIKPYVGMTAPQVYNSLAASNPGASPLLIGQQVTDIWIGGGLAGGIADLVTNLGNATAATEMGVTTGVPSPFAGIAAIGDFFNRLTQANTWVRVGETVLGILLIVSGLMKLSGVSSDLTDIAKAVRP